MQTLNKYRALLTLSSLMTPLFSTALHAQADSGQPLNDAGPGRAMLEFLADYGDTDDETFELMIFHGTRDSANDTALSAEQTATAQDPVAKQWQHKELGNDD